MVLKTVFPTKNRKIPVSMYYRTFTTVSPCGTDRACGSHLRSTNVHLCGKTVRLSCVGETHFFDFLRYHMHVNKSQMPKLD